FEPDTAPEEEGTYGVAQGPGGGPDLKLHRCPECRTQLPPDAVECPRCKFDLETGELGHRSFKDRTWDYAMPLLARAIVAGVLATFSRLVLARDEDDRPVLLKSLWLAFIPLPARTFDLLQYKALTQEYTGTHADTSGGGGGGGGGAGCGGGGAGTAVLLIIML